MTTFGDAWAPLASSPTAFNALADALGVDSCRFEDVLGLDASLLPARAVAFVVCFPPTASATALLEGPLPQYDDLFVRQIVGGACGTIAAVPAAERNRRSSAASFKGTTPAVHRCKLASSSSPRTIQVAPAAVPRLVSTEDPRRS